MKLTGNFENDFDGYLNTQPEFMMPTGTSGHEITDFFEELPISLKFGVFVDFFDPRGIKIGISPEDDGKFSFTLNDSESKFYNSRQKARKEAIKAANKIYNEATK